MRIVWLRLCYGDVPGRDIEGRMVGMPEYRLVGGKCREATDVNLHVNMGAQDSGKQPVESSMKLTHTGCRNLLVAMFQLHTFRKEVKFAWHGAAQSDRALRHDGPGRSI